MYIYIYTIIYYKYPLYILEISMIYLYIYIYIDPNDSPQVELPPHRVVDGLHMAGRLEKGSHLWTWMEKRLGDPLAGHITLI